MARDILTIDGEIAILNGDLDVGYSDEQHIEHILLAQKGEYKQHPLVGIGIADYLNGPVSLLTRNKLTKEINLQLAADKASEVKVEYDNEGKLTIGATYE